MAAGVAILGPGGVGAFIAGALDRAGVPVTVVARPETADVIERSGIRVESVLLGEFTAHPRAVAALEDRVGVLFVATKAGGLGTALERVRAEPDIVVPLLNGLDHVAALRERFGSRAVAGTIRIESDRPEPGRVVHSSPFLRVDLASDDRPMRPALESVAELLRGADVPARVEDSEAQVLWEKLVRLNALACVTAAFDLQMGAIRADPDRWEDLAACAREAIAVARAEGARIEEQQVMAELGAVHDTLGTSMQRDVAAGREPELDAIQGAVLRAAARHGLECPTIAALSRRIAERAGIPPPDLA